MTYRNEYYYNIHEFLMAFDNSDLKPSQLCVVLPRRIDVPIIIFYVYGALHFIYNVSNSSTLTNELYL